MIKLSDRIKERTYTIGTGNFALSGVVPGFSSFSSAYSNNQSFFYAATDGSSYEIGSGVYISASNQIVRFPFKSTNNNQKINFPEGLKEVYVTYPATNSVFNTSGIFPVPVNSGIAFWTSSNSISYNNKLVFDSGNGRLGINKSNPLFSIDVGGNSPQSIIRASGFIAGTSGIFFPSGNGGIASYSGGRQLFHFEKNQLDINSSQILQLSGIVNQNILLKKQNANTVFAGPSGGCIPPCSPDYPTFRSLVKGDLPEEISNWTIGDEESSTFLTINLPQGLPDIVYRDINAININANDGVFAVNGLGEIKFATIGYSQVDDLDSTMTSVSGSLNNQILLASGYLNNRINSISSFIGMDSNISNGRLSLSSSDSICYNCSGLTLHYVPHNGNSISLYDGADWVKIKFSTKTVCQFSELAPNTLYDVFAYLDNDDVEFEVSVWEMFDPAWSESGDSAYENLEESFRIEDISKFDGVYCAVSDPTRKYLGTVCTSNSSFVDTPKQRFIFNQYNRIPKNIRSPAKNVSWIVSSQQWSNIPTILLDPVQVVNGTDSVADLKISLSVSLEGSNNGYAIGIFSLNEKNYYNNNFLTSHYSHIAGDSNDLVSTSITSSFVSLPRPLQKYVGVQRVKSTSTLPLPLVNVLKYGSEFNISVSGEYGIMGTYPC
jgi:hypothetical protein